MSDKEKCKCLKTEDENEYWGNWILCECGYKQNTVHATFCGGCGRKIEIIGVKESEWSGWEGH